MPSAMLRELLYPRVEEKTDLRCWGEVVAATAATAAAATARARTTVAIPGYHFEVSVFQRNGLALRVQKQPVSQS